MHLEAYKKWHKTLAWKDLSSLQATIRIGWVSSYSWEFHNHKVSMLISQWKLVQLKSGKWETQ